jgi:hypothetical protein
MASNKHTGLNPLGIPRIDATKEGINSAFAIVSREVAKRTPVESMSEGNIHLPGGVISVPSTPIIPPRMRPAFNVVMWTDGSDTKAHFQEAFVIQGASIVSIFPTDESQTRTVAIGEVYYVEITTEDGVVKSAALVEEGDIPDLPTREYIKVVEFQEGDTEGTFKPVYYRYDSIIYSELTTKLPYTIYFSSGTTATITEEQVLADYEAPGSAWSIEFAVSGTGEMTGTWTTNANTARFDTPQTFYRLPIIRSGTRVSSGGIYQEDRMCNDGAPVVGLIKVG